MSKVFKGEFDITQLENPEKGKVAIPLHTVQLKCPCLNASEVAARKSFVISLQAKYKALRNADASYKFPQVLEFTSVEAMGEFVESLKGGGKSVEPLTIERVKVYAGTLNAQELEILTSQLVSIHEARILADMEASIDAE